MIKKGEVLCNPVTGERAVIKIGTAETSGEKILTELFISPGGAVAGKHYHPNLTEKFTVLEGQVGFCVGDRNFVAELGKEITVEPNILHDWWNAGTTTAHVLVEISPADRFESMIRNLFGLAVDGKTDHKGMPGFIQLILIAKEFEDVLVFSKAPKWMVNLFYFLLKPVAKLKGLRGSYQRYEQAPASFFV